jgi:hypothetical protein
MKKINLRLILWLLVIICLSITLIVFSDTLALFETTSSGTVNTDVGKWLIKVNNGTITGEEPEDILIDSFIYQNNTNVAPGYIAPGSSAYFDLIIDATDCDVAVVFNVEFDFSSTGYGDNISFSVNDVNNYGIVRTGLNQYSGIISLASINNDETVSIRVTLNWADDSNYDESDTEIGIVEGNHLTMPMHFNAKQYIGESLTPYNP